MVDTPVGTSVTVLLDNEPNRSIVGDVASCAAWGLACIMGKKPRVTWRFPMASMLVRKSGRKQRSIPKRSKIGGVEWQKEDQLSKAGGSAISGCGCSGVAV